MVQDEVPATTTTTTTTEEPWNGINEISAGPHRFYYENGNLPKFLMEVDTGKNIFDELINARCININWNINTYR